MYPSHSRQKCTLLLSMPLTLEMIHNQNILILNLAAQTMVNC